MHARAAAGQRGVVAILVAIMLVALLAFLGLVVDIGHFMVVRGQLQNASDAAALAGARELTGAPGSAALAVAAAQDYASRHTSDTAAITVSDAEVTLWTATGSPDTGWTLSAPTSPDDANAVRVVAARDGDSNPAVPVLFAGIFKSATTQDMQAVGVAHVGGPCAEPASTLVVSAAAITGGGGSVSCGSVDLAAAGAACITSPADTVSVGSAIDVTPFGALSLGEMTAVLAGAGGSGGVTVPVVGGCAGSQDVLGFAHVTLDAWNLTAMPPVVTATLGCQLVDAPTATWCPSFGLSASAQLIQPL